LSTGIKAGKLLRNFRYQAHSVYGEVERHLREMKLRFRPQQLNSGKKDSKESKVSKVKGKK